MSRVRLQGEQEPQTLKSLSLGFKLETPEPPKSKATATPLHAKRELCKSLVSDFMFWVIASKDLSRRSSRILSPGSFLPKPSTRFQPRVTPHFYLRGSGSLERPMQASVFCLWQAWKKAFCWDSFFFNRRVLGVISEKMRVSRDVARLPG